MEPDQVVDASPTAAEAVTEAPARESFAAQMERLGGFSDESGTEEPRDATPNEAPEAKEEKAEKPAPKAKAAPAPQTGDKLSSLKDLAKELGFELQGEKVSIKERAEFREAKRKHQEALNAREQKLHADLEAKLQEAGPKLQRAEAFNEAIDKGDILGAAKVMGFESWDALQRHLIAQTSDPNYKKLRELETWKEEQARKEVEQREANERQAQERQRQEAVSRWFTELSTGMKTSKHPLLQSMADDPLMLQTIYRIQEENYEDGSTVTPEQALKLAVKGAKVSLEEELKGLWNRLNPYFAQAAKPPTPTNVPGKKPAPKSAPVPPSKANGAASGNGKTTDRQWRDLAIKRLEAAAREEQDS